MKRALIIALIVAIPAFAAASPVTLPEGAWVLVKPSESYVLHVYSQYSVNIKLRSEGSCELTLATDSGQTASNKPLSVSGRPGNPQAAQMREYLSSGMYNVVLKRGAGDTSRTYIRVEDDYLEYDITEREINDDIGGPYYPIYNPLKPISGIAAFNDPADCFRIAKTDRSKWYTLYASGVLNGFTLESLDSSGRTLSKSVVRLGGRGEVTSTANALFFIPEGAEYLRLKNVDACRGKYSFVLADIAPPKKLVIPKKLTLAVGTSKKLNLKIKPASSALAAVGWGSNHPDVASVDQDGVVTAISPGTATINVEADAGRRARAKCLVTVK